MKAWIYIMVELIKIQDKEYAMILSYDTMRTVI